MYARRKCTFPTYIPGSFTVSRAAACYIHPPREESVLPATHIILVDADARVNAWYLHQTSTRVAVPSETFESPQSYYLPSVSRQSVLHFVVSRFHDQQ